MDSLKKQTKYVVVSGGVISGIGKGVIASSVGFLLKQCGLKVTAVKIDPYLNIDAGTFSPYEHGEVFVLDDGGEVDLDLGNYERFLGITLQKHNNITTGKVYQNVINKERRGDYLGSTVQVVPHLTNEIQEWIERVAQISVDESKKQPEVCIVELGGTVGDIESAPFVEAMRQFQFRVGDHNFCLVHVSLVPQTGTLDGEQKTKPTQASVRDLRGLGLYPDMIICRSTLPLQPGIKEKISMFCHVEPKKILAVHDCSSVYEVPLLLVKQDLPELLYKKFHLNNGVVPTSDESSQSLSIWSAFCRRLKTLRDSVRIAIVGKYTGMRDAYMSVIKALEHASVECSRKLEIIWIEAEYLEKENQKKYPAQYHTSWEKLCSSEGVLVPGGFGDRGILGMVSAIEWARSNKIPFLGICLGLQVAVIEHARNVLGWEDANSTEFDPATSHPVVEYMPEVSRTHKGGTMRLGLRTTHFQRDCLTKKLYGQKETIQERHRHRYEVNPQMVDHFESAGLHFVGRDDSGSRMEILELDDHPFFVAVQYHPEYLTRPLKPHPVFRGFISACNCGK
ncbi:CTP synthase 1-like [Zophobas morio]|uniref:CTP synthase 1-like n=1 Tax=Zophobas morio TaxID=2755281 RepID=UPI0030831D63